MEQVATVEPAVPQTGSAAPESPASAPDFGAQYKAHVFKTRPTLPAAQPGASSGNGETSAADEQQASDAAQAGIPDTDGDGSPEAATQTSEQQQKLSRSQRKALKAAQSGETPTSADTSASPPAPDTASDPVTRVERVLNDRLAKLETLLQPQAPPTLPEQEYSTLYSQTFGDDAEYARRAQIAISQPAELSIQEQDELAVWATNRKAAELTDVKWKRNFSAAALSAAEAHGLDPQTVVSAASPRDIFAAFVERGKAMASSDSDARVAEVTARADKLESANRLLADEVEALRGQVPAGARRLVVGGVSAVPSPDGPPIDRQKASGRQLLAAGIARQTRAANGTRRDAGGYARGGR